MPHTTETKEKAAMMPFMMQFKPTVTEAMRLATNARDEAPDDAMRTRIANIVDARADEFDAAMQQALGEDVALKHRLEEVARHAYDTTFSDLMTTTSNEKTPHVPVTMNADLNATGGPRDDTEVPVKSICFDCADALDTIDVANLPPDAESISDSGVLDYGDDVWDAAVRLGLVADWDDCKHVYIGHGYDEYARLRRSARPLPADQRPDKADEVPLVSELEMTLPDEYDYNLESYHGTVDGVTIDIVHDENCMDDVICRWICKLTRDKLIEGFAKPVPLRQEATGASPQRALDAAWQEHRRFEGRDR
jgi:hypothetical protein